MASLDLKSIIHRIPPILSLAGLAAIASLTILISVLTLKISTMQNYGENAIFVSAWGLVTGHGLYRLSEMNKVPVFIAAYTPIYYLIVAAGMKVWGLTYVPGRIVAILSMVGCAALVGLIAHRRGCGRYASAMAGVGFLSVYPVYIFAGLLRVDFLAFFFELLAVFIILGQNGFKKRAIFFAIFGIAAGFTKQTAFGLIMGCLLGMLISGDKDEKKQAVIAGLLYALGTIAVFLTVNFITGGDFYYFVISAHVAKDFDWVRFVQRIEAILTDSVSLAVLLSGCVGIFLYAGKKWLAAFCLTPMAWTLLSVGNYGSGPYYFIEPMAAFCVGMAVCVEQVQKIPDFRRHLLYIGLILSLIVGIYQKRDTVEWARSLSYRDIATRPINPLVDLLKTHFPNGGIALASNSDLPILAGCETATSDPFLLTYLAEKGKWDPAPLVKAIKDKKIKMVISSEQITPDKPMEFLPRKVAAAILETYIRVPGNGVYDVYVPEL